MADIFISYARADRDRIEKLAAALEGEGYSVWWDRNLTGGGEFSKEIEAELNAAKAVIVAWSADGVESPWVRDEAAVGRKQEKLFPISLDGEHAPLGFQQYHTIDFSHWRGAEDEAFTSLNSTLGKKISGVDASTTIKPSSPSHFSFNNRPGWMVPAIAAGALLAVAAMIWAMLPRTGGDSASEDRPGATVQHEADGTVTLGVIPFETISADPDQEYFADGLSEELLNWLANVEGLRVPGRTASFQFKGKVEDVAAIGARLGVNYLLEGSVRRSGNQLRITSTLVEVANGATIWSETYNRELDDIFEIQDDVAQKVVTELLGELPPSGAQNPAAVGDVDPRAHELYLEGRSLWTARNHLGALDKFQAAIDIDPGHWLAQSYFAIVGANLLYNGVTAPRYGDNFPSVLRAALAAAEAQKPEAADVLFARGWVTEMLTIKGPSNPEELNPLVADYYQRAIRANPRHAEALHALSRATASDEERAELYRRVLEIEPGHMSATMNYFDLLSEQGQVEIAQDVMRRFQNLTQHDRIFPMGDSLKLIGEWRSFYEMAAASLTSDQPKNSMELRRIAMALADLGQLEASAQLSRNAAVQLEGGAIAPWVDSRADLLSRDFDAVDQKAKAFSEAENAPSWMPTVVGKSLLYTGNEQEVLDLLTAIRPDLFNGDNIELMAGNFDGVIDFAAHNAAIALDRIGRAEEADRLWLALLPVLEEPRFSGWRRHIGRAMVYAQTDDPDKAIAELDLAYDAGFRFLYSYYCQGCLEIDFFVDNTYFGPVFEDPRFQAFVDKIEKENAEYFNELDQTYGLSEVIAALKEQADSGN